jgi:hypothetical protein
MIDARFVSIETWPGTKTQSYKRKKSTFRAKYSATLDDLEREISAIRARDVLIQTFMRRDQIRNDGWPKSNATTPAELGVILSFTRDGKTVSMPCDKFTHWEDNLRAIALSLQALRSVDRYGVTTSGEQYRGWESLPPPEKGRSATQEMTKDQAIEILGVRTAGTRRAAAIEAMKRAHPDKGGTPEDFRLVHAAAKILGVL